MTNENMSALFVWAQSLSQTAAQAGMAMQALPESREVKDFVGWAKAVTAAVGGMMPLPALADDAGYDEALAWAKALDGAARGMGASLPNLP